MEEQEISVVDYESIKQNYDLGYWTPTMVYLAARKGIITPDEYNRIVDKED